MQIQNDTDTLAHIREKSAGLASRIVMPWDYHCGRLYKNLDAVLTEELGTAGQEAVRATLEDFAARFGDEAAQVERGVGWRRRVRR